MTASGKIRLLKSRTNSGPWTRFEQTVATFARHRRATQPRDLFDRQPHPLCWILFKHTSFCWYNSMVTFPVRIQHWQPTCNELSVFRDASARLSHTSTQASIEYRYVKGKAVLAHAMKAYEEVEEQLHAFLISELNGARRRLRTPAALFPGKEPSYTFNRWPY